MSATDGHTRIAEMKATTLAEVERLIEDLAPKVAEYNDAIAFRNTLAGGANAPARPRSNGSSSNASRGDRQKEFMAILARHPDGITASEMASELGLNGTNYVYTLRNKFVSSGKLRKEGSKMFPTGDAEPSQERMRELEAAASR